VGQRVGRAEGGEIHWGDETALVNTDVRGRSYAPRGKTPVTMSVGGTREKLSMISTVTNRGRANWMIIAGAFNHERLIEYLHALVLDGRRRRKKVFLILGNLGVHHCKPVKAWLAEQNADIEVFYLPGYSPELNPDERLDADLKHAVGSKVPLRTKARLRPAADEPMNFIAANPERVRAYFHDPIVKYAALKLSVAGSITVVAKISTTKAEVQAPCLRPPCMRHTGQQGVSLFVHSRVCRCQRRRSLSAAPPIRSSDRATSTRADVVGTATGGSSTSTWKVQLAVSVAPLSVPVAVQVTGVLPTPNWLPDAGVQLKLAAVTPGAAVRTGSG